MKFKVGQKYEVGAFLEKGNIIEIISIDGNLVYYRTIKGDNGFVNEFEEISEFVSCLKPLKPHCIVIYENGAETVALDKTTGKKAVAKCSPQDTYDFYTGAKLAFERLTQQTVQEVKREAKIGEYIKVVNACVVPITNGVPEYKNGDILKVLDVSNSTGQITYGSGRAGNKLRRVVNPSEYVVLEGYEPPKQYFNGKAVCVKESHGFTTGKVYEFVDGITKDDNGKTRPTNNNKIESLQQYADKTCGTCKFIKLVE